MFLYKKTVSPDDLKKVITEVPPDATDRWYPLPHDRVLQVVLDACKGRGWEPGKPTIVLSNRGEHMGAFFDLPNMGDANWVPTLAAVNSNQLNSQGHSTRIYGGLYVASEGVSVPLSRHLLCRHTKTTAEGDNLSDNAKEVVSLFAQELATYPSLIGCLEMSWLPRKEAMSLVLQLSREGAIPWQRVGHVDHQIAHLLARNENLTLWRLLLCALKGSQRHAAPYLQLRRAWSVASRIREQRILLRS